MKNIQDYYRCCRLCPRGCSVDRTKGEAGFCGMSDRLIAARAALHFWEEPCISGEEGSGTVFFSGCSLGCVFCQNHEISGGNAGKIITVNRLSEIFLELQEKGANNINLVTPDHFAPSIAAALELSKAELNIPVICNCSGYMSRECFELLKPYVNIWLPDMKYFSDELAERYSSAPDYYSVAFRAVKDMLSSAGKPVFDERGMMLSGVIIRHMILPGQASDSIRLIRRIYSAFGDDVYISIMNQYTPMPGISRQGFPELDRHLTGKEYERVINSALRTGIKNGFIQEGETSLESFIPPFDMEGI